jgi:hypothetical protein
MTTLYTLSTLNEYTWTAFYLDKPIYLSYIAVSKTQAISGLINVLSQIENTKKYIDKLAANSNNDDELKKQILDLQNSIFVNFYLKENKFQYSYDTIVTTVTGQQTTIGDLINRTEPSITRFRLGTIRDY